MINYDKERNEVVVKGCSTCPFINETPRGLICYLGVDLFEFSPKSPSTFPKDCPLRDPNFKLTRVME